MEIILLIVIALQFSYMVYKDILFSKEREQLQLKLMSKDISEYKYATETPKEEKKVERQPDEYLPIEDIPIDRIVNAEVKL